MVIRWGIKARSSGSIGDSGENQVAKILARLPEDKYKIINNLLLINNNGDSTQIDHIVVSEYGIFVIETKTYKGWISGHENSEFWTQTLYGKRYGYRKRHVSMDRYKLRNPIIQNYGHIRIVRRVLEDSGKLPIYSIVAFPLYTTLNITAPNSNVVYWNDLRQVIQGKTEPVLSAEKVEAIYSRLVSANCDSPENRTKHIENVKRYQASTDAALASCVCPKCGGKLVLRDGRYGQFYGCSNYPKCTYTHNVGRG